MLTLGRALAPGVSTSWAKFKHSVLRRAVRRARDGTASLERRELRAAFREAGADPALRINTWTTRRELATLYSLSAACPRGAVALEIGSYLGASTCYLAAGLKHHGGHLYCVDTWENQTMPEGLQDTFALFERNTAPFSEVITSIRKRSEHLKASDISLPLDLVFIDGDHSFGAVSSDFSTVSEWISEGGVIAFHDVSNPDYPGVSRLIGRLLSSKQWKLEGVTGTLAWMRKMTPIDMLKKGSTRG